MHLRKMFFSLCKVTFLLSKNDENSIIFFVIPLVSKNFRPKDGKIPLGYCFKNQLDIKHRQKNIPKNGINCRKNIIFAFLNETDKT